jgi:hypothetical protein
VAQFGCWYSGTPETIQELNEERREKLMAAFTKAKEAVFMLPSYLHDEVLDEIYRVILNAASHFTIADIPSDFVRTLYNERPQACTLTVFEKSRIGFELTAEEQAELDAFYDENPVFAPNYTDDEIDMEMKCKREFVNADDKLQFIKDIINNKSLNPMQRAELIWYCTDNVLGRLHMPYWDRTMVPEYNWTLWEQILDLEEDFLTSDDFENVERDDIINFNFYYRDNTINQIIVYAATNKFDLYESSVSFLMNEYAREVAWYLDHCDHWQRFVDKTGMVSNPLSTVVNALTCLRKAHLILPHLLKFEEGWKEYLHQNQCYDEDSFFSIFRMIAECAFDAYSEIVIPTQYQLDFVEIELIYRDKMDKIAGTDYVIKAQDTTAE